MDEEQMAQIAKDLGYDGPYHKLGSDTLKCYNEYLDRADHVFLRFVEGKIYEYTFSGTVGVY